MINLNMLEKEKVVKTTKQLRIGPFESYLLHGQVKDMCSHIIIYYLTCHTIACLNKPLPKSSSEVNHEALP